MEFKDRLRMIRWVEKGITQKELEERTGIKREYISKLEGGDLGNPTYSTLKKLAKGLDVPLEYLIKEGNFSEEEIQSRIKLEILGNLVKEVKRSKNSLGILGNKISVLNDGLNAILDAIPEIA